MTHRLRFPNIPVGFPLLCSALLLLLPSVVFGQTTYVTNSNNGTANTVPVYTGSTTLTNSPISVSGGNVGIGNTSPGYLLELSTPTSGEPMLSKLTEMHFSERSYA